jgi:hypothetical protein
MTLKEASESIGRNVTYKPYKDCDLKLYEYGVITSTNDSYVFVQYTYDTNSKATRAEDIELG